MISVSFDERKPRKWRPRARHVYLTAMKKPFPEDGWRFLTGDSASIRRLTDAVGYRFERQGNEFAHPVASRRGGRGRHHRPLPVRRSTFLPKDLALALVEAQEGVAGGIDPQGDGLLLHASTRSARPTSSTCCG